jgi:hypothetical protein
MFRAVVLAEGHEIGSQEFPQIAARATRMSPIAEGAGHELAEPLMLDAAPHSLEAAHESRVMAALPSAGGLALLDDRSLPARGSRGGRDSFRHLSLSEVARKLRIAVRLSTAGWKRLASPVPTRTRAQTAWRRGDTHAKLRFRGALRIDHPGKLPHLQFSR